MTKVYLGLGSNLGDRYANICRALGLLEAGGVRLRVVSPIYETEPVGYAEQSLFLNAICCAETDLAPLELLRLVKAIEAEMGRKPSFPNAPRPIDMDILLYGAEVVDTPELVVPHPRMAERAFVLVPLADLAPNLVHPLLRKRIRTLLRRVSGRQGVRPWGPPPPLPDACG